MTNNFINEWKYGEDYWKTEDQIRKEQGNFKSESPIDIVYEFKPKKDKDASSNQEEN